MKLKNKRSGEIKEFVLFDGKNELQGGATLEDLVEEWEDYEEPKTHWFINSLGEVEKLNIDRRFTDGEQSFILDKHLIIGNCFETKEEAERAVEKLKAWKRLKDKGFRFDNFVRDAIYFNLDEEQEQNESILNDLDLLFGGEE